MTLCADQFETSTSPPSIPQAFERFLCPGSREFDVKGHPGGGEFDFSWVGWGNLNQKCEFWAGAYQTHMVVSEHGAISRERYRFS